MRSHIIPYSEKLNARKENYSSPIQRELVEAKPNITNKPAVKNLDL